MAGYAKTMFTGSVREAQEHYGTRETAKRMEEIGDDSALTGREIVFITSLDGFYMASVGDDGWPYMQFRGGPAGFLKVLDPSTLAYGDFRGNKQYISTGNLRHDDRVALFFMDYANRQRLKLMARTEIFDAAERSDLLAQVEDPGYAARIERVVLLHVVAFDWNCPQHITPRFTEQEFASTKDTGAQS